MFDIFGIRKRKLEKKRREEKRLKFEQKKIEAQANYKQLLKAFKKATDTIKSAAETGDKVALDIWRQRRDEIAHKLEEVKKIMGM